MKGRVVFYLVLLRRDPVNKVSQFVSPLLCTLTQPHVPRSDPDKDEVIHG